MNSQTAIPYIGSCGQNADEEPCDTIFEGIPAIDTNIIIV